MKFHNNNLYTKNKTTTIPSYEEKKVLKYFKRLNLSYMQYKTAYSISEQKKKINKKNNHKNDAILKWRILNKRNFMSSFISPSLNLVLFKFLKKMVTKF